MRIVCLGVVIACLCVQTGAAYGQANDARAAGKSSAAKRLDARYSHKGQVGVSALVGVGLRGIFAYDGEFCGDVTEEGNRDVCLGRSPVTVDLSLSYGVLDALELLVDLRLGLERDFGIAPGESGPRMRHVAPGIRAFFGEEGGGKFFSTLQLVVDFSDYEQATATDIGARNQNGFQFDLHETVGVILWVGETVTGRRWLQFELDGGIGIQARFP